jgi:polyisoprenoid-binding protein YceI
MSLFLSIFSITTNADEYKIDNEHSFITFKIRHFNAGYVLGRFNIFSGNITFGEKIESSSTNVSINSLSIDTGVAKRDFHLRTAEFLDILKFPEITFKSNKIVAGKDNRHFLITGKLKIKNMEKDITIKAKQLGKSIDPYGQVRVAFKGTTTLNRFDYNINFDGKLKDGNPMIGSKIYTLIFIEAIKVGGVR